jgi:hypothetical protein
VTRRFEDNASLFCAYGILGERIYLSLSCTVHLNTPRYVISNKLDFVRHRKFACEAWGENKNDIVEIGYNRKAPISLNVYLSLLAFSIIVDDMNKDLLALGLVLILISLALFYFSDTVVYQDNYVARATIDNSNNYAEGLPAQLSVAANFTAGDRLFFNFTNGRFWGTGYDQQHGLEPANPNFVPGNLSTGVAIEAYKVAELFVYTPSGDAVWAEDYLVGGNSPFAVVYYNQSADFVPLLGGNLTFANVGIEGTTERTGSYTVKITDILPPVMEDAVHVYRITTNLTTGDPPLQMYLWNVETVGTKPYFVSSASAGGLLLSVGAVSSVWAGRSGHRRRAHDLRRRVYKK